MPNEKPPGSLQEWQDGYYKQMQEGEPILDTECQLAVLAIVADGNPWTGFSGVLAEGDGDGGSVGYRFVSNWHTKKIVETYHWEGRRRILADILIRLAQNLC